MCNIFRAGFVPWIILSVTLASGSDGKWQFNLISFKCCSDGTFCRHVHVVCSDAFCLEFTLIFLCENKPNHQFRNWDSDPSKRALGVETPLLYCCRSYKNAEHTPRICVQSVTFIRLCSANEWFPRLAVGQSAFMFKWFQSADVLPPPSQQHWSALSDKIINCN